MLTIVFDSPLTLVLHFQTSGLAYKRFFTIWFWSKNWLQTDLWTFWNWKWLQKAYLGLKTMDMNFLIDHRFYFSWQVNAQTFLWLATNIDFEYPSVRDWSTNDFSRFNFEAKIDSIWKAHFGVSGPNKPFEAILAPNQKTYKVVWSQFFPQN